MPRAASTIMSAVACAARWATSGRTGRRLPLHVHPARHHPASHHAPLTESKRRQVNPTPEAIRGAVAALEPGDVLLIAGKGHETGQIIGSQTLDFSDHKEVEAALRGKVA